MAKDSATKAQASENLGIAEAVLGKAAVGFLDGTAQRNLIAGGLIFALGVILAAVGGPAEVGSSAKAVVGWGAILVGVFLAVRGLSQRFWPLDLNLSPDARSRAQERRDVTAMALFAALLFVPWLGAVGLWDPWEVHYGEVARTMVQKRDFVFPYWENAYFFSKPPLTMWLQGLGIALSGGTVDNAPLPLYIEWGMRLPFAILSIIAVAMTTLSVGRIFSRRAGLIAGFAVATCPLYFMLARQAVTDTPFVTLLVAGMACLMVAEFDPAVRGELSEDTVRFPYLMKHGRALVLTGLGVGLAVTVALEIAGSFTPMVQQLVLATAGLFGGNQSALISLLYPLFYLLVAAAGALLGAGVVAFFVWLLRSNGGRAKTHAATIWWAWAFAFFSLATLAKGLLGFMLPGLILLVFLLVAGDWRLLRRSRLAHGAILFVAIAVPWFLTLSLFGVLPGAAAGGLDDESKTFAYRFFIHDHLNRLTAGVHTTTPGGTFTYFIEQLGFAMFPWVALVPGAMVAIGKLVPRDPEPKNRAALLIAVWAAASFFLFAMSATKFHHYCFPVVPPLAMLCALWADRLWKDGLDGNSVPILLGIGFFAVIAQNIWMEPKVLPNMFIYNYDRTYPTHEADTRQAFAVIFIGGGLWLALAYIWRAKAMLVGTFAAVTLLFAGYISYIHWEKLTPHWTQRELMWTYYHDRGSPNEPLIAYYMNWRGETFYSSNQVRQIKDNTHWDDVVAQPGRFWVLVEQSRFAGMKSSVEAKGRKVKIEDRTCNKFFLASVM